MRKVECEFVMRFEMTFGNDGAPTQMLVRDTVLTAEPDDVPRLGDVLKSISDVLASMEATVEQEPDADGDYTAYQTGRGR